jgi:hypothetical protein
VTDGQAVSAFAGSDRYGIPNKTFGLVPEAFYGMVGRVAMLSALLELRLLDLRTELCRAPQDAYTGQSGTTLIGECRARLPQYEPAFADTAGVVLGAAREALLKRHEVIHSVWPEPGLDSAYGWRPVPERRRKTPGQTYVNVTLGPGELAGFIATLVDLVHEVDGLRQAAPQARKPMP